MNEQNEHIDDLIIKHLENTASVEEQKELVVWVKLEKSNERYFIEMKKLFASSQNTNVEDFNTVDEFNRFNKSVSKEKHNSRKLIYAISGIAATLTLLLGAWFMFIKPSDNSFVTNNFKQFYSKDSIKSVTLEDGTIVTLSKNSSLKQYSFLDKMRKVESEGTLYFEVARDEQKPFVIDFDFVTVRVLGTKFEVSRNLTDSSILILVTEGKVQVTDKIHNTKYILTQNQRCIVWRTKMGETDTINNHNFLAWKTGLLEFEQTPLSEAIKDLETYYQKPFSLSSAELGRCLLRAKFDKTSLEDVKSILSIALEAQIEDRDSVIFISAKPCSD